MNVFYSIIASVITTKYSLQLLICIAKFAYENENVYLCRKKRVSIRNLC